MSGFPYVYRWNRMGRKGQLCRVTARGTMNSACVEFEDGFTAVTSRNALRKARLDDYDPGKDGHDSYLAAVEAKRLRGDTWWPPRPQWRIVSPAPPSAVLELAGAGARARRMTLAQARHADTAAVMLGDQVMAIAYFARHGWRRVEMALSIAPAAAPHMRRLVRMAQLTLQAMAEDRIVVIRIRSLNVAGQRMAAFCGFRRHGDFEPGVWILRKPRDAKSFRQQ